MADSNAVHRKPRKKWYPGPAQCGCICMEQSVMQHLCNTSTGSRQAQRNKFSDKTKQINNMK